MSTKSSTRSPPPIVLFGYDSSPFTQKVRLSLQLRQIPYTFCLISSMMPRPLLVSAFNCTYRKIPVLAIGKELYIDTSLITETLATHPAFPVSSQHPALHANDRDRTLTRILSSHYTDRPLFRYTTGVIPKAVWETTFGDDRAGLIGHKLDAAKLGAKIPSNVSGLDTFLSILEPLFASSSSSGTKSWFLDTPSPSLADISLFYQLQWGEKISRGEGLNDLTGGQALEGSGEGITHIFNKDRYPGLLGWFERMKVYFDKLPNVETRVEQDETDKIDDLIRQLNSTERSDVVPMLRTSAPPHETLDERLGLKVGAKVSVAPADTGRNDPTIGTLVALSPEEVVIEPDKVDGKEAGVAGVRIHFPRVEFLVRPVRDAAKAKL